MDDKKSVLTSLPPLLVAVGTLITAVIGLGNFMSSPTPSVTEFDVSPSIIDTGGNATLKWIVSGDVSSISIEPEIGTVALSGSRQISPTNTTNYTLTAKNKGQVKTASARIIVRKIMAAQSVIKENDSASIQKPAAFSAPFSASKVGDEPVHNDVPIIKDAAKNADNINSIIYANNANNVKTANKASNADSAAITNTVNTTAAYTVEKTAKDKPAISNEPKPSGSATKNAGDEFMQMSDLEPASRSEETIKPKNTSSNSAAGDEPIQAVASKSVGISNAKNVSKPLNATNQTGLTKTKPAATKTKVASNVGDVA